MKRVLMIAAVLAGLGPALASAQTPPVRAQGRRAGAQRPPADSMQRNRAMLEAQVQQRIGQVLQNRLGATDEQMVKVREINARYSERRRNLLDQERELRMTLRQELGAADSSRQAQVADLLDRMLKAQRQRIEILELEQRDLAAVLTPMQRATYIGIEEQLRQRLEGMRGQGLRGRAGEPPDGPGFAGRAGRRGPPPPP